MAHLEQPAQSMRKTSDFVLRSPTLKSYDDLNAPTEQEGERKFATELGAALNQTHLDRTGLTGGFSDIYLPTLDRTVAIKVLRPGGYVDTYEQSPAQEANPEVLNQLLQDQSYIVFADRTSRPKYEELTDHEKGVLYLAHEHQAHEQYYGKFIPPAKFVVFNAANTVEATEKIGPDKDKWWKEHNEKRRRELRAKNKLASDDREIYLLRGEQVCAQVEDFQIPINHKAVSNMHAEEFTPDMLDQLQELRNRIEQVYQEHGIYPDHSMLDNNSGNLIFNQDGQLTLLDTNRFQTSPGDYTYLMDRFDVRIQALNERFGRT